jgi:branched-chain amino acid transport system ATP-binding protein
MDKLHAAIFNEGTRLTAAELAAENVTVRFRGLSAISQVSLLLRRNEVFGLIGPNGAGKTTLVNCLSGFQQPTSGRILIAGSDAAGMAPRDFRREGITRTFQAGRLFKSLTVRENIEVATVALGLNRHEAARQTLAVLDWLGIADKADHAAGTLPYTDERRVGIARALIPVPAFVLLDEPAAGMSEVECENLMSLILDIPKIFGCGVRLIEHSMQVIMGVCDRIHVLNSGQSVAEGTPLEIQRSEDVIASYLGEAELV